MHKGVAPIPNAGLAPVVEQRPEGFHNWRRHFPYGAAFVCLSVYLTATLAMIMAAGWPLAYPLDDSYIHLAVARTLAISGVWGAQPTDPAAASSSPLWSLLLAGIHCAWPAAWIRTFVWMPLLLNLLAGVVVLGLWHRLLAGVAWRWVCMLLLWFAVPLSAMSLIGMEHVLHVLLATALTVAGAHVIADDAEASPGWVLLTVLALLAVAVRYESLFIVVPLVVLCMLRHRLVAAAALGFGAVIPVLGFGALWIAQGGWLLPNPIMLKGLNRGEFSDTGTGFLGRAASNFINNLGHECAPMLVALTVMLAVLVATECWRCVSVWRWRILLGAIAAAATLLHLAFASIGWLYRYEAYLVALSGLASILLFNALLTDRHRRLAFAGSLALFVALVSPRAVGALIGTIEAVDDRRLEHLLPAEFIQRFYAGRTVVANDLGAAAYFGGARILDMAGLGNNEPVRLRRRPEGYDTLALRHWAEAEGAAIAILQVCWYEVYRRLPPEWTLVAVWRLPREVVFHSYLVGFVAIRPEEARPLRTALDAFRPPATIGVRYASEDSTLAAFMAATDREPFREPLGCHP
jgi:hypothetical protein